MSKPASFRTARVWPRRKSQRNAFPTRNEEFRRQSDADVCKPSKVGRMPCRTMAAIRRRQDWSCPLGSPFGPSEKGIMVWRFSIGATGYELARPRARPEQRGAALDRRCPTARFARRRQETASGANFPRAPSLSRVWRHAGSGRGLSRARRQPRLADASRRFAVACARVDRCARLRRQASMGFDGPIRPFGPDVRVEAHETKEPSK